MILIDSDSFSSISYNFNWVMCIFIDLQRFPSIFIGLYWFPKCSMIFIELLQKSGCRPLPAVANRCAPLPTVAARVLALKARRIRDPEIRKTRSSNPVPRPTGSSWPRSKETNGSDWMQWKVGKRGRDRMLNVGSDWMQYKMRRDSTFGFVV